MPLTTVEDVIPLLKRLPTDTTVDAIETLIPMLEAELASRLNRHFGDKVVVGEIAKVIDGWAVLRHSPVQSVQQVRYLAPSNAVFTGTRVVLDGRVYFEGLVGAYDEFAFDYTAGVDENDSRRHVIKSLVVQRLLRILAKIEDDALGVGNQTQEGYNAAYLSEGWNADEVKTMQRLRKMVIV